MVDQHQVQVIHVYLLKVIYLSQELLWHYWIMERHLENKQISLTSHAISFYDLFRGSAGITSVSEDFLPATTLTNECYREMFLNCSALTTAPELPAATLADYCYDSMFYGCSSLNSIKISYIGIYDSKYFYYWVYGIASSGTFYYNGNQIAQDFQFPSGWAKEKF